MLRPQWIAMFTLAALALGCDPAIDATYVRRGAARPVADAGSGSDASSPGQKPEPGGACGDIDYLGRCFGNVARWCEEGRLKEIDCATRMQTCGFVNDMVGYYCTAGGGSDAGMPRGDAAPDATNEAAEGCGRSIEQQEFELTNQERMRGGLTAYTCDDGLTRAARAHAQDMCDRGYFSHSSQDGRQPEDRVRAAGVMFNQAGENIAWGQTTPAEVNQTWMNSFGHRAAIMSNGFRRIGVGYVACDGRPHWVQNFAD